MNDRDYSQFRLSGSVNLRPTRIGFLVSPSDHRSIRQAICFNTVLWGGQFNPIIPVFENRKNRWAEFYKISGLDVARGLVRFFEPDVIVESAPGLAAKIGWNAGENYQSARRLIGMKDFATIDTYGRTQFEAGISISDIYATLYQKEFRFERRHKVDCAIPDSTPSEDAFLDVVMGNFPVGEHLAYLQKNFRDAFSPVELPHNAETLIKFLEGTITTPLWFTRYDLKRDYESSRDPTIFVFDPKNPEDVIDFWNFRIFERWVFPIHLDWFGECSDWIKAFITNNFHPLKGNPNGIMTHTTLEFSRSISEVRRSELTAVIAGDVPKGSFFQKAWYEPIWQKRGYDNRARGIRPVLISSATADFDEDVKNNESFRVRIPGKATTLSGAWRPRDPVDDDRGGARA
jgi:hypothetical protein